MFTPPSSIKYCTTSHSRFWQAWETAARPRVVYGAGGWRTRQYCTPCQPSGSPQQPGPREDKQSHRTYNNTLNVHNLVVHNPLHSLQVSPKGSVAKCVTSQLWTHTIASGECLEGRTAQQFTSSKSHGSKPHSDNSHCGTPRPTPGLFRETMNALTFLCGNMNTESDETRAWTHTEGGITDGAALRFGIHTTFCDKILGYFQLT